MTAAKNDDSGEHGGRAAEEMTEPARSDSDDRHFGSNNKGSPHKFAVTKNVQ